SFNGAVIEGATGSTLTLTNVQVSQAGTYIVQVTNALGSASSPNVSLAVSPAPACVAPPAGLVSWWKGEGNAGDSVGANDGALLNGAAFGTGEVGQAFSFDGMSQHVRV